MGWLLSRSPKARQVLPPSKVGPNVVVAVSTRPCSGREGERNDVAVKVALFL